MMVKLIAAVGRQGQLGLNGGLPWGGLFPDDRKRFRDLTAGCVVVVGARTWPSIKHLQNTNGRVFLCDNTGVSPSRFLWLHQIDDDQTVWIAGGAKTYLRWLPWAAEKDITVLPWDGLCDTWMPAKVWKPEEIVA